MFTDEEKKALLANEANKSAETYFSSKESNDNFFENFSEEICIVGLQAKAAEGQIGAHNRVLFSDGHMMSTTRLFGARGIQWPVGGSVNKVTYLMDAIDKGIRLAVTPDHVALGLPFLTKPRPDGEKETARKARLDDCRKVTATWRATWSDPQNPTEAEIEAKPEGYDVQRTPTFHFKPVTFPAINMAEEESA